MAEGTKTPDSLRSFTDWLQSKALKLTAGEMRLSAHLLKHPELWAFESTGKLSEELEVHRSTVVRFAQNLGFAGYPELQTALRKVLLNNSAATPQLVLSDSPSAEPDLLRAAYEREVQNLKLTYENLHMDALQATARGIAHARRVLVFGRRFSYPIALHLSLSLRTMRDLVLLAPDPGGSAIDSLFDLGPEDHALVVTLRRFSPEVERVLQLLADSQVPRALLTDVGPIAQLPDGVNLIQAHVGSHSVLDSYTALTSLCHVLITMVANLIPESSARLSKVERSLARFYS